MAQDEAHSSWHPAFMPNSLPAPAKPKPAIKEGEKENAEHIAPAATQPTQTAESDNVKEAENLNVEVHHDHDAAEAWLENDGDEADAWLVSEDTEPASIIPSVQTTQQTQPEEIQVPSQSVHSLAAADEQPRDTFAPVEDDDAAPHADETGDAWLVEDEDDADAWLGSDEPKPAEPAQVEPNEIASAPPATRHDLAAAPTTSIEPEQVEAASDGWLISDEPESNDVLRTADRQTTKVHSEQSTNLVPTEEEEIESSITGANIAAEDTSSGAIAQPEDHDGAWLAAEEPQSIDAAEEANAEPHPEDPLFDSAPAGSEPHPAANTIESLSARLTEENHEAPVTSLPQHGSSMSFARTVSHEIGFDDEDDGEWNLSRADTDTFSFMPPSDRTNSFPAVPPMTSKAEAENELPLPSNQALDVMEETEKEAEFEEEEYMMRSPESDGRTSSQKQDAARSHHAPSRSIGGELEEPITTAAQARYEEGLPLIPQSSEPLQSQPTFSKPDPFADEGDNDDFFENAGGSEPQGGFDEEIRPLERKSTLQFVDESDISMLRRRSTLDETIEEHDEVHPATEPEQLEVPDAQPATTFAAPDEAPKDDLASKWEQAFGGDDDEDDFLLEDSTAENNDIDPTAFLGSDDEGLLDDDLDEPQATIQPSKPTQSAPNPYTPSSTGTQQAANPYAPVTTAPTQTAPSFPYGQQPQPAAFSSTPQFGQVPQPPRTDAVRAQSFADKSKGGYASPYDLPTDLVTKTVKPRSRPSMQNLSNESTPPPPPRSASMYSPGQAPVPASAPPGASIPPVPPVPSEAHGQAPPLNAKASAPVLRNKSSFFEELPMSSKPRPASRHSNRAPSPGQGQSPPPPPPPPQAASHTAPPATSHAAPPPASRAVPPPQPAAATAAPPQSHVESQSPPNIPNLVAPAKVNPYATLQSQAQTVTPPSSSNSSRYSPAPAQPQTSHTAPPPATATSRYSPAPPGSRPGSSYSAGPGQNALPHMPRTSSPLAHFDSMTSDGQYVDRRASSSFEPRLNRVASLPPTREVDEEEEEVPTASRSGSVAYESSAAYPAHHDPVVRQTPPLTNIPAPTAALSPPKRTTSNYTPQSYTPQTGHAAGPPPQASTQSHSVMPNHARKSSDSAPRPSSAHAHVAPAAAKMGQPVRATSFHGRRQSLATMSMVPPTDGREHDPLERWRGTPIMTWGVGGVFVTSFPKSVPRYAMNQNTPTVMRTVGEVKVQNIKDLDPLSDRLANFPGPLKGKSKKKEAIAWLTAGIDTMEKEIPDIHFHSQLSLEAKRSVERILLWKLLRVFIEHDGTLDGNPAVEKAVREILAPGIADAAANDGSSFAGAQSAPSTAMNADSVDASAMEKIRLDLLKGDRETAVWSAVDKRLWGHAMLISQTVSPDLYKQVAQEFVRKEVNYAGHNNESLAALYKILSGNYDDCVDELVPSHARAGLQLVSTEASSGPTKDAMDGLDKWRETLTLVVSNRSVEDVRGLHALGKLLASYGRAEAAHICFIFSRSVSVFGGLDDPNVDFVLVGSDHRQQSDQFAKEAEALQLSEVYEYGLSLAGGVATSAGAPHLAAYKLQQAVTLAEYGFRDRAMQYCDAIATAVVSQTRRSPYHHPILEVTVDDLMTRLKQAPKEASSSSWISKPSMNKVSDSMWNRFNKFVSGDENENHAGSDADTGPFARIGSSPNVSRPPSTSNFDVYGAASPGYSPAAAPPAPAPGTAASRYAPAANQPAVHANPYAPAAAQAQAPASPYAPAQPSSGRNSHEYSSNPYAPASAQAQAPAPNSPYAPAQPSSGRNSHEYSSNSYEPSYPGVTSHSAHTGGYTPAAYAGAAGSSYQPTETGAAARGGPVPAAPAPEVNQAAALAKAAIGGGYQPHGLQESPNIQPHAAAAETQHQGYQPTSYGYEPPQMTPSFGHEESQQSQPTGQADTSGGYEPHTGGYEPPSFQPYSYEPPSYEPDPEPVNDDAPKPKKKSFMDDDDDDIPALRKPQQDKSKAEKDRENQEMFRKAAEEDAKRAAAAQSGKKGWGFGGWFGGAKKAEGNIGEAGPGKAIRAKLGEESSFVYDVNLGRWVSKKPGAETVEAKKATPPPPRAGPSATGTPPPGAGRSSVPPPAGRLPPRSVSGMVGGGGSLSAAPSMDNLSAAAMTRSVSTNNVAAAPPGGPPSRPTTSMSNASSIDDLLGAPAPRKAGQKKPRKSGRYVDVMAK